MTAPASLLFFISDVESSFCDQSCYFTIDIEACAGAFSGASACVVRDRVLEGFLQDLSQLADFGYGEAHLVGGWAGVENISLRFSPADSAGHIRIHVALVECHTGDDFASSVSAFFLTEPQSLRRFVAAVRGALVAQTTGTFPVGSGSFAPLVSD